MDSKETSPKSKRHSFPATLSYTETLSVLSEHQRQYNDKEIIVKSHTPLINTKGSEAERKESLQNALDWLRTELKDMHHQDKFLLRQFNHLNRTIQDLKSTKEVQEAEEKQVLEDILKEAQRRRPQQATEKKAKVASPKAKTEKGSLNEYDSDYGSDQSMDRFEDDIQASKNIRAGLDDTSLKLSPKQRNSKRWSWWK